MKKKINGFLFSILFALGLSVFKAQAQAPQPTVILSVPYVINAQGNYVLGGNLTYQTNSQTQAAITVNVGYVTIDLNGFYLIKPLNGDTSLSFGILASNKANITVRNGTIIGVSQGIRFDGTNNNDNNRVEAVRFNFEQMTGILLIDARNNLIRDCSIANTGFDTQGNIVTGNGDGIDILSNPSSGNSVIDNRVSRSVQEGIHTRSGQGFGGTYLENNLVSNCPTGFDLAQDDKYRSNTTIGCQAPFFTNGATDLGGNN
jgi:Periplasmic copper-binding protein (NosD)